jgi:hypothetical protein
VVYYLSASGDGIERYAETDSGVLDMPQESFWRHIEFAEPDKVHPSALKENVSPREQGYWVKPETMPKRYLWANGAKPLPDVLPGFVVSSRFKELVEKFEPEVHQFVPVEIYKQRNGEPVETYYWFIVGQRLDSVDREHTTYTWQDGERGLWVDELVDTKTWNFTKIPNARLFYSNDRIGAHHIWHDPHVIGGDRLCSSSFGEALLSSGLTGVSATPRGSV